MIFTTKAEYGVRLLVELGRQASGQPVSLTLDASDDVPDLGAQRHPTRRGAFFWPSRRRLRTGFDRDGPFSDAELPAFTRQAIPNPGKWRVSFDSFRAGAHTGSRVGDIGKHETAVAVA